VDLLEPTIFPGWAALGLSALVLCASQLVYAMYGFGSGLLAVALLAFVLPELSAVVPLLVLVSLPTEAWISWRDRRAVSLEGALPVLLGLLPGALLGAWALGAGADQGWLLLALGVVILLAAGWLAWSGWQQPQPRAHMPRSAGVGAGLLSGALAGLFGTGGPPLILWYQLLGLPKQAFRATLLAIFLLLDLWRVPAYLATGLLDRAVALSALLMLPAGLLGLALGQRLHLDIPERHFRLGVALLLGVLGLLLMFRG